MTKSEATIEEQPAPLLSGSFEPPDFPDWFRDQQRAAREQFESLPQPTRKDQPWQFTNVNLLALPPYKISAALSEDHRKNLPEYSVGLPEAEVLLIFANNQ